MNNNDPLASQSEPTAEGRVNNEQSTTLQKAQRYLGLIAVVWLAYVLLSPRSGFGVLGISAANPRSFILNESYHHKTVLSDFVIALNQGDAWEVKSAGEYIVGCETAKRSVSADGRNLSTEALLSNIERLPPNERKKAAQLILDACAPPFLASSTNHERALEIEPKYWDFVQRYQELRKEARIAQGLKSEGLQQPVPTPEMVSISERLEEIRKPLVQGSATRLIAINGIVHVLVVVLIGIGIWFRRSVGWAILAPFGWVFSGAKKVHEKI